MGRGEGEQGRVIEWGNVRARRPGVGDRAPEGCWAEGEGGEQQAARPWAEGRKVIVAPGPGLECSLSGGRTRKGKEHSEVPGHGPRGRCPSLAHLNLRQNDIRDEGAGQLAAVLGQCPSLAYLELDSNGIGTEGAARLAVVLGQKEHPDVPGHGPRGREWSQREQRRRRWQPQEETYRAACEAVRRLQTYVRWLPATRWCGRCRRRCGV